MGNSKGPYICGEKGCKGHDTFNETCSTTASSNKGLAVLDKFITGEWQIEAEQPAIGATVPQSELDTQPYNAAGIPGLVDAPLNTETGYKKKSDLGKAKQAKSNR